MFRALFVKQHIFQYRSWTSKQPSLIKIEVPKRFQSEATLSPETNQINEKPAKSKKSKKRNENATDEPKKRKNKSISKLFKAERGMDKESETMLDGIQLRENTIIVDSHCHIWNVNDETSTHSKEILGRSTERYPYYGLSTHVGNLRRGNVKAQKVVLMESLPADPLKEVMWMKSEINKYYEWENLKKTKESESKDEIKSKKRHHYIDEFAIVARVDLSMPNLEEYLKQLAEIPEVKGVRHIINWHPTDKTKIWPLVKGNYLRSVKWLNGLSILNRYHNRFTLDLQVNPIQLSQLASAIQHAPRLRIVIDHNANQDDLDEEIRVETLKYMNSLGKNEDDELNEDEEDSFEPSIAQDWFYGMRTLSKFPNVYVKLSMPQILDPRWSRSDSQITQLIEYYSDTFRFFRPSRCMIGSNFPVELPLVVPKVENKVKLLFPPPISEESVDEQIETLLKFWGIETVEENPIEDGKKEEKEEKVEKDEELVENANANASENENENASENASENEKDSKDEIIVKIDKDNYTRVGSKPSQLFKLFQLSTTELNEEEREMVYFSTAAKFYRLSNTTPRVYDPAKDKNNLEGQTEQVNSEEQVDQANSAEQANSEEQMGQANSAEQVNSAEQMGQSNSAEQVNPKEQEL